MKTYTAAVAAMCVSSIWAATCSFKVTTYSATGCTGATTGATPFTFENLPIGTANDPTKIESNNVYATALMCDPDLGVTFVMFSDAEGKTPSQVLNVCNQMVCGFRVGDCFSNVDTASSGSYKLENVVLSGNKFGVGWLEGWGVFFCSAVLFGLC